jgi:hypothetical protein
MTLGRVAASAPGYEPAEASVAPSTDRLTVFAIWLEETR